MPESYETVEFDVFKKAIDDMQGAHGSDGFHDCDACGVCHLKYSDIRELWDTIYASGLVVSAGVRVQDIPALSKDQAWQLVRLWGKKYNYISVYYQERFVNG